MAYTNAIFYLDYVNGSDSTRATLSSCTASNPSGSITRINKTGHGLVTGAVVTLSNFTSWLNGSWKITKYDNDNFDLDGATWQATADATGDVVPFGGMSWSDAWKTINSGATAARIAPGDIIRIAKSADPVSLGNAKWSGRTSHTDNSTVNISSSTNANPIEITTSSSHNLSTGDVVQITGHTTNTAANGCWVITYVSSTKFTLDNSTGNGVGGAAGSIRQINHRAVVLSTEQTKEIDRCEFSWTGAGDTTATLTSYTTTAKEGNNCVCLTQDASTQADILQAYRAISSTDFSAYQSISLWIYNSGAITETSVNAGSFTTGKVYRITSIGTTDFTLIGASSNTVGVVFIATGAGTGNGTAVGFQWYIALCSDNAGTTIVDLFPIPAIASTTNWIPLTIPKAGGGNLGASIQSIAIYSGTTAPAASKYLYIDNIIACTTTGLSLRSLISKNGSASGGTEGFYGIQSINGKVIILDVVTSTNCTYGRGYCGTTETVETFHRIPIPTSYATSTTGTVQEIMDSGNSTSYIEFQGGYNTSNSSQDGETFFDGGNSLGYGLYVGNKNYVKINRINATRYNIGLYLNNTTYSEITFQSISNCQYGADIRGNNNTLNANYVFSCYYQNIRLGLVYSTVTIGTSDSCLSGPSLEINSSNFNNITVTNLRGSYNSSDYAALYFSASYYNKVIVTTIKYIYGTGIYFASTASGFNSVYDAEISYCSKYAVYFSQPSINVLDNISTNNNVSGAIQIGNYGKLYCSNLLITESTEFNIGSGQIYSKKHDRSEGNDMIAEREALITVQSSVVHDTEPIAYKINVTNSIRGTYWRVVLPIGNFAATKNESTTITAWVKKDHATNIAARLVIYANTTLGITEQSDTKADDTNWEQLSVSVVPTNAYPVIQAFLEVWYVAASANVYLGSVNQT